MEAAKTFGIGAKVDIPRRILITGGSGFIGTHLAARLVAAGWTPRLFDLQPPNVSCPGSEFCRGDMTDLAATRDALEGCLGVVHLGAVSRVGAVTRAPHAAIRANIFGTATVVEAARMLDAAPWLLLASSVEVVLTGDGAYGFTNLYGVTKATSELLTHCYAQDYGVRVLALRFAHLYGSEYDKPDKVPRIFVEKALQGAPIQVNAAGGTFDFLHVEDAISAVLQGIDWLEQAPRGTYAGVPVVTGTGMTLPEVVELIIRLTGSSSTISIIAAGTPREPIFNDPQDARDLIGFRAAIMVEEGLLALIGRLRDTAEGAERR